MAEVDYVLKNGVLFQQTLKICDNPADIFGALNENFITYVSELFDGIHYGIKSTGGSLNHMFIKEVSHLRFATMFGVDDTHGDVEHFIDYDGGIAGVTDWVVPDGYRMFFALEMNGARFPFHMLLVTPEGKFAMIPMSNCHDGGSVCHGNVPVPNDNHDNIAQRFAIAMDAYWKSGWNDHLIDEEKFVEHNRYIFRWDMDMNQLPMIDPEKHLVTMMPSFSGSSLVSQIMKRQDKPSYQNSADPKAGKAIKKKAPAKKKKAKVAKA